MSWCGKYGRGSILSRFPLSDRIVVATSLAKAFAAGGAALVFSREEERERVRMCGGPMVFSGPLQPPLLGAALASAKLHLTPELVQRQEILQERVRYANRRIIEAGLPLLVENEVPIVFIRCGLPRVSAEIAQRLSKDGIYVNVSMYPSVPMRRSGIRCGITASHTHEDIDRLVAALEHHVPAVLAEERVTREELDALFEKTVVSTRFARRRGLAELMASYADTEAHGPIELPGALTLETDPANLSVERFSTIAEVDAAEWDRLLGERAHCSAVAMKAAEAMFHARRELHEHRWSFEYVFVRDEERRPVAATVFTTSIQKDDMLMRARISEAIEERRAKNPYFLTSLVTQAGTGLSEGDHLYLDRRGPWRAALHRLIEVGHQIEKRNGADLFMLRDLAADDVELGGVLLSEGLINVPMPPTHEIAVSWASDEELIESLPTKRKRRLAREVQLLSTHLDVEVVRNDRSDRDQVARQLYRLYRNVADRGKRLNSFPLPPDAFDYLLASDAWEIVALFLKKDRSRGPVACFAAHNFGTVYAPLVAGLDYEFLDSLRIYKQLLFQIVRRGQAIGARTIRLGMTADQEKERWGSVRRDVSIYAQSNAEYNASLLRQIVAEVGMAA
jgi:hypothetical protein